MLTLENLSVGYAIEALTDVNLRRAGPGRNADPVPNGAGKTTL
jgi:ABC-type Mn2+/Zn2+ transport system ATPase subunit